MHLDVFNGDAFSVVSLTDAINDIAYKPGRIGQMGIFAERRINTTIASIEARKGVLRLIPATPRGGPGTTLAKDGRRLIPVEVPHFEIDDAVNADEVQNIRAFGSETELETVAEKVAERQGDHVDSFAVTEEHQRLGAIKGLVTYADDENGNPSRPALDIYQLFGIARPAPLSFNFAGAAADGALLTQSSAVNRAIGNALGGTMFSHVHAFVGDAFYDGLLGSKEVRDTFKGTSQAEWLRAQKAQHGGEGSSWGVFEFGGIIWENYRGSVGDEDFIDADEARFFPVGVPKLFQSIYAPADYIETVNTLGRRLYTKQWPEQNGKRVKFESQMNALQMCTRPQALQSGVKA